MHSFKLETATQMRLEAFKAVAEAILEEPVDLDELSALVVNRGLRAMLGDILGNVDADPLLESIYQMAEENPSFVYEFTAARLRNGAEFKEAAKKQMGFLKSFVKDGGRES